MRATGGVYLGFRTLRGRKFPYGNFRTSVFCVRQNTDCRKNEVFRQSQAPRFGKPPFIIILEYLRGQARRSAQSRFCCAQYLRDTARIPPPPCATRCRSLPTAAAPGSGRHEPDHCPRLRTLTAAFRTAQRTGTAYRRSWPVHGRTRPAPPGLRRRYRPTGYPSAAQSQGFPPLFRVHRHTARPDG